MPQPVFRQFPLQQGSLSRATPLYNQPKEIFPYTKPFCPVCNETMEEWEEHLSPFGCDVSSNGKALRNQLWDKHSQKVLAKLAQKHTNQKHPQFKVWNITGYLYHDKIGIRTTDILCISSSMQATRDTEFCFNYRMQPR
jgi:hypothetical protein